jgi:hypothetical protein
MSDLTKKYDDPDAQPGQDDAGWASSRHPLNVTHLVMGIAFLGFVGIWAVLVEDVVEASEVRWLLPLPWVLAGIAGLLAISFGGRRSRDRDRDN